MDVAFALIAEKGGGLELLFPRRRNADAITSRLDESGNLLNFFLVRGTERCRTNVFFRKQGNLLRI